MNNIEEKFLPLGTVVLLKGAEKRLMITGFCTMPTDDEKGTLYDYCGCMYPEGIISTNQTALFNHEQIEKVFFVGYSDEEEKDFKFKLKQLINANKELGKISLKDDNTFGEKETLKENAIFQDVSNIESID